MSASRRNAEQADRWAVVLVFGIIAALYFTREILVPLAFALTLTFLLTPAVNLLESGGAAMRLHTKEELCFLGRWGILEEATSSGSRPSMQWCWSLSPMESMVPGFVRHTMV